MKKIDNLKIKIAEHYAHLSLLKEQEKNVYKNSQILCGKCNKRFALKDSSRIIIYFWDYCEDYNISDEKSCICPKCNWLNRLLSKKIEEKYPKFYSDWFKNTIYEYHHSLERWWLINTSQDDFYNGMYLGKKQEKIKKPYIDFVNI